MGFLKDKTAYNQVTDDNALNLFWVSVWNGSIFRTRKLNRNNLNIWRYTEVSISSAELLALGDTPKQLLPAPGSGKYYDFSGIVFEYTFVTTGYNLVVPLYLTGADRGLIRPQLINEVQNVITSIRGGSADQNYLDAGSYFPVVEKKYLNSSLNLMTWDDSNPTDGDGTLLVKIWYQVKTFGTEL